MRHTESHQEHVMPNHLYKRAFDIAIHAGDNVGALLSKDCDTVTLLGIRMD